MRTTVVRGCTWVSSGAEPHSSRTQTFPAVLSSPLVSPSRLLSLSVTYLHILCVCPLGRIYRLLCSLSPLLSPTPAPYIFTVDQRRSPCNHPPSPSPPCPPPPSLPPPPKPKSRPIDGPPSSPATCSRERPWWSGKSAWPPKAGLFKRSWSTIRWAFSTYNMYIYI